MGKSKVKKIKKRSTPVGLPISKTREDELENSKVQSTIDSTISSLLDQLQVPGAEENLCGLRRLSELFFGDDKMVKSDPNHSVSKELHEKFIKVVAPFLVDSRSDVRNAAAGALRNVSVAGGLDICDVMVSNDIMTPLVALIQKCGSDNNLISDNTDLSEEESIVEKEKLDTLLQAVYLLLNLCESSEIAIKYFNSSNLLTILLKFMSVSAGRIELSVAIAQCLHTVSDDNSATVDTLRNFEDDIRKLIMIQNDDPSYLHLRTLAAGLLVNIHGTVPVDYINCVFEVLNKVIEIDSRNELCNLSSETPLENETMLSSDTITKLEKLIKIIDTQITAFEILTNLCSGEEDDNMEVESSFSESEVEEEDVDLSNYKNACNVSVPYPLSISCSHVHEAFIKLSFLENSFNKTNLPLNVIEILGNHNDTKIIVKKYNRLRSRAFHFLNNLITVLDPEDVCSPDDLFKLWSEIGHMILTGDNEILEASTAALRAVLTKLVSIQHPGLSKMTSSDLEIIFQIVKHSKDDNICANIIQIVSVLGVYYATKNLNNLLKDIGKFILAVAERPGPLWLIAEALDALMDVFAEDNTDIVTEEISLVSRLSVVAPIFKRKVRVERKTLGDHYALITTANNNLARFITYKKNRPKCN